MENAILDEAASGEAPSLEHRVVLTQAYEALRRAADALGECLTMTDRGLPGEVYLLGAEDGESVVEVVKDAARARTLAAAMVRRLQAQDRQEDLARVARLPGVLAASARTQEAAAALNAAKESFRVALHAIPEALRREAIRRICPGAHLKQIYRRIPVLSEFPRRVSFGWAAGEVHMESLTYGEVAQLIDRLEERCNSDRDPAGCRRRVEGDRRRLANLARETAFAIVRPVPPHPRVNIVYAPDARPARATVVTSLPILVPPSPSWFDATSLRPLPPYRRRERLTRRDRRRGELFLPPLSVYLMGPRAG